MCGRCLGVTVAMEHKTFRPRIRNRLRRIVGSATAGRFTLAPRTSLNTMFVNFATSTTGSPLQVRPTLGMSSERRLLLSQGPARLLHPLVGPLAPGMIYHHTGGRDAADQTS